MFSNRKRSQAQDTLPKHKSDKRSIAYTVHLIGLHSTVAVLCLPVFAMLIWLVKNLVIHLFTTFSDVLFGLIAPVIACALAICVVVLSNPMHALLSLVGVFLATVLFYVSSGIEFIGLVFLIVYVGAVAILFLFVIMLLNVKSLTSNEPVVTHASQAVSLVFGGLLAAHLYVTVADQLGRVTPQAALLQSRGGSSVTELNEAVYHQVMYRAADVNAIAPLYTEHAPLFWITTANLLLSLLGAIVLATSTTEQTIKVTPELSSETAGTAPLTKFACPLTVVAPLSAPQSNTSTYPALSFTKLTSQVPYSRRPNPLTVNTKDSALSHKLGALQEGRSIATYQSGSLWQFLISFWPHELYAHGFFFGSMGAFAYLFHNYWRHPRYASWAQVILFLFMGMSQTLLFIAELKAGIVPPWGATAYSIAYIGPLPGHPDELLWFDSSYPLATMEFPAPNGLEVFRRWLWFFGGIELGRLFVTFCMYLVVQYGEEEAICNWGCSFEELGERLTYWSFMFFSLVYWLRYFNMYW